MDDIILCSERINFIKKTETLIPEYIDMMNDKNINKFLSREDRIYSEEDFENILLINKLLDNYYFSLIDKKTNFYLGDLELIRLNQDIYEINIVIKRKMQDKHYATEALNRIILFCKDQLEVSEINITVFKENEKAIHIYKKIGFKNDFETQDSIKMKKIVKK